MESCETERILNGNEEVVSRESDDQHVHVDHPSATRYLSRFFSGGNPSWREEDEPHGETGWFLSSMLIVNAALGAGLLNFPHAFHEAGGILISVSVQMVLMVFIIPALLILAYCSDFNFAKTLQDVMSYTWGKAGQRFTSVIIAIYCFGTCVTFIIIIGDQFDRAFASLYGPSFCEQWYMNRVFTMTASSLCFILPLCFPKKIDFLKHASSLGVIAVIYVVFLIISQYYVGHYEPGPIKTKPEVWTDIFLVIPTICFGYQCHVSVIPIYSCFRERNLKQFTAASILAISICIFTYTIAATFGYLTFGSKVTNDILESYDATNPFVLIAIVAIAVKTFTTYPILLFCGREAVSNIWLDLKLTCGSLRADDPSEEKFRRYSIASIWFTLTLVLGILSNFGIVVKLLGSLAAIFIFIVPGMCLLKVSLLGPTRGNLSLTYIVLSGCFLIIGSFLFGCVLTQAIIFEYVEDKPQDIPLCVWSGPFEGPNSIFNSIHLPNSSRNTFTAFY